MKKVLIVGIFIFMTKLNCMLSSVEHEKSFITSGSDQTGRTCLKVQFLILLLK